MQVQLSHATTKQGKFGPLDKLNSCFFFDRQVSVDLHLGWKVKLRFAVKI